jgi:CSLREA domain-containing protein
MKTTSSHLSGFFQTRALLAYAFCFAALAFGFLALVANASPAVTITVNSLADTATAGDSNCTLREAINNFNAQADTTGGDCASGAGETLINFNVSGTIFTYALIVSSTPALTIDGTGQNVVLDGSNTLFLLRANAGTTVTVQYLTFQNGVGSPQGGAIDDRGTVNVANCTFTGNSAIGGGAINNVGVLNVTGSYFANNTATNFNRGGGAIANVTSGVANVANSTFYNNSSINTTGAIQNNTTMTLTNCTFSNNSAPNGGSSIGSGGTLNVVNTIFANSASGGNCLTSGTFNADSSNLSDDNTCGNATQATSAQINLDSTPANNGGPTLTIKLLPGSVAIDSGKPEFDQRGPNFFRVVNNRVDVGAFEVQLTPGASLAASASASSGNSVTTPSFLLKANTTYLVFAFTNSAMADSATFSSTFSGSPTFTPIGAGSLFYNSKDYNFGQWVNGGASDSTGTIKVTFAKNTHQAYLQVIQLSGNNISNPIAQSAYASGNNTHPYTANLPAPPSSGDNEVAFLSANEDLGASAPPAMPSSMMNLIYRHAGGGSAGSYANPTAIQNTSFAGGNHHWGTIAVEINHY